MILHSALDYVDDIIWTTSSMNLKVVDRFSDWNVSAYITGGGTRFMLLHEQSYHDGIKGFFLEVYELYLKVECLLRSR